MKSLILVSIIALSLIVIFGMQSVDARCLVTEIPSTCSTPPTISIKDVSGQRIDTANLHEQYTLSYTVPNYLQRFIPCNETIMVNASQFNFENRTWGTVLKEKCISGNKWVRDERIDDYSPSPVTVILQVQDKSKKIMYLAWVNASVPPNDAKTFTFSWTPYKTGQHTLTVFTWKSLDNPTALLPPISTTITVNKSEFDIPPSKTMELSLASPVEFIDDGRDIQRSILQKSPAPRPMYDRIMDSMEDGVSVNSDGIATITSISHEKYSVNPDTGFYAEDWMPEHIPEGQKLLYTETTCFEKTGDCGLGIHFVPTTFVLHENVTSYDLEVSKGFMISVKYSLLPLDNIEDIVEEFKESRESQSGNYGGFVEMTRDGKIVYGYDGGNDYNHYHASVYFQPNEHMGVGVHSDYHSLEELIPIFESVMK